MSISNKMIRRLVAFIIYIQLLFLQYFLLWLCVLWNCVNRWLGELVEPIDVTLLRSIGRRRERLHHNSFATTEDELQETDLVKVFNII